MFKKPSDFGGLTHKVRKIAFSCFRCPVFAFLVSRLSGYLMGIRETPRGTFTAVQGQHWYEFDMMGQILADHKLPRGFLDASHESVETVNGTVLLRSG